jgi:hypothetical protein
MFPVDEPIGALQAKGLLAQIRDCAGIPDVGYGVPLATASARRGFSASSASGSSSTSKRPAKVLPGVYLIKPSDVKLPDHIIQEAKRLRFTASSDNPLSEHACRALVFASVIHLVRQGVVCKSDHPGVIERFGELLHAEDLLPLNLLQCPKGKKSATTFADRIVYFMANKIRPRDGQHGLVLEVPSDGQFNTPLRALEEGGYVKRCEPGVSPTQGHSGRSIIGRGRPRRSPSPLPLDRADAPASTADTTSGTPVKTEQSSHAPEAQNSPDPAAHQPPTNTPAPPAATAASNQLSVATMLSTLANQAG